MFAAAHSQGSRAHQRLHNSLGQMRENGLISENEKSHNRRVNRFRLLNAIEAASERARLREHMQAQLQQLGSRARLLHHQPSLSVLSQGVNSSSTAGLSAQFASHRSDRRASTEMYATRSLFGRLGSLADQAQLTRSEQIWNFFSDPMSSRPAWVFGIAVFALIITSCVSFIVESIPQFCCGRYDSLLEPIEAVCIAFFTLEYMGRLCTVPWYWPDDKAAAMVRLHEERQAQEAEREEARLAEEEAIQASREATAMEKKGHGEILADDGDAKSGGELAGGEPAGAETQEAGGASGAVVVSTFSALGWRRSNRSNQVHPHEGEAHRGPQQVTAPQTTWKLRLRFAAGVMNVIDLVAIIPFYVELVLNASMGRDAANLSWLRVLRLVRVFRVLKISKYSEGLHLLANTMERSARTLLMLLLFEGIAVILLSSAVYLCERGVWCDERNDFCSQTGADGGPGWYAAVGAYSGSTYTEGCRSASWCRQKSKFDNIFVAAYWCIQTMTTTGYGDLVPYTVLGKLLGCLTMLLGLVLIALPITVISENFAQEYQQQQLEQLQAAEEAWLAEHGWLEDDEDARSLYEYARRSSAGGFSSSMHSHPSASAVREEVQEEGAAEGDAQPPPPHPPPGFTSEVVPCSSHQDGEHGGAGAAVATAGASFGAGGEICEGAQASSEDREGEGEGGEAGGGAGSQGRGVSFGSVDERRPRRSSLIEDDGDDDVSLSGDGRGGRRRQRRVSWGDALERDDLVEQEEGLLSGVREINTASAGTVGSLVSDGGSAVGTLSSGVGLYASQGGGELAAARSPGSPVLVSTRQELAAPPRPLEEEDSVSKRRVREKGRGMLKRKDSKRAMTALERELSSRFLQHRKSTLALIQEQLVGCTKMIVDEIAKELQRVEAAGEGEAGAAGPM